MSEDVLLFHSLDDYPDGTWLGDENNPEMRVRSPVSPADMLHISTNCRTAEKMALTLLDYLFHREVQAVSNLSGQGKHGKKQLDPLMIYGIRCKSWHLSHLLVKRVYTCHLLRFVINFDKVEVVLVMMGSSPPRLLTGSTNQTKKMRRSWCFTV